MFIIEGADNLGKTTAAKHMVKLANMEGESINDRFKFPVRYAHMTRPGPHFDFFHDYRDMMSRYAVQDRFHLGALAWHTKDQTNMSHDRLKMIEAILLSLGSVICVIYAGDDDWYEQRLRESNRDEMFDVDKIMEANRLYRDTIPHVSMVDIHWDVCEKGMPSSDSDTFREWLSMWCSRLQHIPRA
jgi:hypothetical protein